MTKEIITSRSIIDPRRNRKTANFKGIGVQLVALAASLQPKTLSDQGKNFYKVINPGSNRETANFRSTGVQ